jgi:hypothetical protein
MSREYLANLIYGPSYVSLDMVAGFLQANHPSNRADLISGEQWPKEGDHGRFEVWLAKYFIQALFSGEVFWVRV